MKIHPLIKQRDQAANPEGYQKAWWLWPIVIALVFFVFLIMWNIEEPVPSDHKTKSDREYIEEGAERLNRFCDSNPDAC